VKNWQESKALKFTGGVVMLFLMGLISKCVNAPPHVPTAEEISATKAEAYIETIKKRRWECSRTIRDHLDDPGSMERPLESSAYSSFEKDGKIYDTFEFRANNRFGAKVRATGACSWRQEKDGSFTLLEYASN